MAEEEPTRREFIVTAAGGVAAFLAILLFGSEGGRDIPEEKIPENKASNTENGLRLSVRTDKKNYQLGEPVRVTLKVDYVSGDGPMAYNSDTNPSIDVSHTIDGGVPFTRWPINYQSPEIRTSQLIPPGKDIPRKPESKKPIERTFNYLPDRTGDFKLRGIGRYREGQIEQELEIKVNNASFEEKFESGRGRIVQGYKERSDGGWNLQVNDLVYNAQFEGLRFTVLKDQGADKGLTFAKAGSIYPLVALWVKAPDGRQYLLEKEDVHIEAGGKSQHVNSVNSTTQLLMRFSDEQKKLFNAKGRYELQLVYRNDSPYHTDEFAGGEIVSKKVTLDNTK